MADIVRTRKVGAREKSVIWTLKDGDGNVENVSALTPGTDFAVKFQELDDTDQLIGASFAGTGAWSFVTDGTDGQMAYQPAPAEVATARKLQAEITVTFASGNTEVYPTDDRFMLRILAVL